MAPSSRKRSKRRNVDADDEEEVSPPKKARLEEEEEEEEEEQEEQEEELVEEPEEEPEEEEPEEEPEEVEVELQEEEDEEEEEGKNDETDEDDDEQIAPKRINLSGKPAEAGIINKVQVENFMCHRKLTVELCPNVNFIHGQNGSGKSAILAAIQICLGAGARRTHRARNLAELIRKESNSGIAKIQVTLRNQGDDGFQREKYGDSITVERIITNRAGGGGYKLLDEHGKSKSSSKKDLDAMLDQLNIQVENPVAVLDQEDAKKFLTGKPEDKYNFFAKATDLERMDRTYANVVDSISELTQSRDRVSQSLEGAVDTVKRLKKEVDQFTEIEAWEDKIGDYTRCQAWAAFGEVRTDCEKSEQTYQAAQDKAEKRKTLLEEQQNMPSNDEEKAIKQARLKELSNESNDATELKREVETQLKMAAAPLKKLGRDTVQLQREVKQADRRLLEAEKRLRDTRMEMQQREEESEQAKRMQELEELKGSLTGMVEEEKVLREQQTNALRTYQELEPIAEDAGQRANGVNRQVTAVKHKISQLQSSSAGGSSMATVFAGKNGARMAAEVQKLTSQKRWAGRVVGPIGCYIKIAPGKERYTAIAQHAMGNVLDRFIVTNSKDRALFMKLRNEIGCRRECGVFQVTVANRYIIPPPPVEGIETAASCLTVEDDLVFNTLVDQCQIDTKAIGDSREETERLLLNSDGNGNNSIRGGKIKQVFFLPKGDIWSVNKQGSCNMRSNERKMQKMIGADTTSAVEEGKLELQQLQYEHQEFQKQHEVRRRELLEAQKVWNQVKKAQRNSKEAIEKLENSIAQLQTEVEASSNIEENDTTELEEDVVNIKQDLILLKDKIEGHDREKEELLPAIEQLKLKVDEVEARNERVLADMEVAEKDLTVFISASSEREAVKESALRKYKKIVDAVKQMEEAIVEKRSDTMNALRSARLLQYRHDYATQLKSQAEDSGEERGEGASPTPDLTPEDPAEEDLQAVEIQEPGKGVNYYAAKIVRFKKKIVEERQKRKISNTTFEESHEKYQRAKKVLQNKNQQLNKIGENVGKLEADLLSRRRRWKIFRKHLVEMSQATFDEILQLKGSAGNLDFDHKTKTLNLVVQKDNTDETSQTKDVKALSGGERSFVTLSLLLAIGERLETPFRVMDEFDVFLDPVTRKIAMDTLVEIAKKMDHRQFILITPQDLSNITPDHQVKIFKLTPPTRGNAVGGLTQQTLD